MEACKASRRGAVVIAALSVAAGVLAGAPVSFGNLSAREQSLQQSISADNGQIQTYEGRLSDLRARLTGLESSLAVQWALLVRIQGELASERAQLTRLKSALVSDRRLLAAQRVSHYESPPPDIVGVVLEAHGFTDLLDRVDQMRLIARSNAGVVKLVARDKARVEAQTARLSDAQARQERVTSALLVERDQVERVRLSVLERERASVGDRARKQSQLRDVRRQLAILQARAAAAQRASFAVAAPAGAGYSGGGFAAHAGDYGFFPAPGTNYTVGQEPAIAARLDELGKALGLHLIGLSGYRSPQHSVEVGGFADDPHTRGEASDTPGVEGVAEQTLLRFGLTRPFGGAAEADHIQLA